MFKSHVPEEPQMIITAALTVSDFIKPSQLSEKTLSCSSNTFISLRREKYFIKHV